MSGEGSPPLTSRWKNHPRLGEVRALVKFDGEVRPRAVAAALGLTVDVARALLTLAGGSRRIVVRCRCGWRFAVDPGANRACPRCGERAAP